LEAQAVIAALVYQKPTLAAHLLDRRDRLSWRRSARKDERLADCDGSARESSLV